MCKNQFYSHFRSAAAAQLSSEQKFSGQGSFEVNKLYGKTPNLTMNCTIPPSTGQLRSGHLEVNNLYGNVEASNLTMNSMNAPNNSTMQCGCENIDCPFCNLLISVQTREGSQVQCPQLGNFMIFLSLRFYVKSILGILEVQNFPFVNTF